MICFSANVRRINSNIAHSAVLVQLSFWFIFTYYFISSLPAAGVAANYFNLKKQFNWSACEFVKAKEAK